MMKLGTEDKTKVWALAVFGVIGIYFFYSNVLSDSSGAPAPKSTNAPAARPAEPTIAPRPVPAQALNLRRATPGRISKSDEFHPVMRSKRPEEQIDPTTIDPTLRLDLLAKVQSMEADNGKRNIFQFGQPPPVQATAAMKGPEPIVKPTRIYGPMPAPPKVEPVKEVPPPPTPINLKYYGYSVARNGGAKTAFFLDGEDILVAPEGGLVKKRYKVIRIGVDSVVMEDTTSNRQQSIRLLEEVGA